MNFEELQNHIPYAMLGKEKSLTMSPYPNITLAMPGRHSKDTIPKGGDFVVMVSDKKLGWKNHQFTHTDIFKDIEARRHSSSGTDKEIMSYYHQIILGLAPAKVREAGIGNVLNTQTFLHAVQCLAVAEHRRYAQHESKFGGRYLPFRFAAGISEGLWTATDAADKQKMGRPGVEWLEKDHGLPAITKILMGL